MSMVFQNTIDPEDKYTMTAGQLTRLGELGGLLLKEEAGEKVDALAWELIEITITLMSAWQ